MQPSVQLKSDLFVKARIIDYMTQSIISTWLRIIDYMIKSILSSLLRQSIILLNRLS